MSSVVASITFLCLFFAMAIGLAIGLTLRIFGSARVRPSEGENSRTLRLVEVSAAESRKELAELRAAVLELRAGISELGLGDSLKKLTLLDVIWNKLGLLESASVRLGHMEQKLESVQADLQLLPELATHEDIESLEDHARTLDVNLATLPHAFEARVKEWRDNERIERIEASLSRLDVLSELPSITAKLQILDNVARSEMLVRAETTINDVMRIVDSTVSRDDLARLEVRLLDQTAKTSKSLEALSEAPKHIAHIAKSVERVHEQALNTKALEQSIQALSETVRENDVRAAIDALGSQLATKELVRDLAKDAASALGKLASESSTSITKLSSESKASFSKLSSESSAAVTRLSSESNTALAKLSSETKISFSKLSSESNAAFSKLSSESSAALSKLEAESRTSAALISTESLESFASLRNTLAETFETVDLHPALEALSKETASSFAALSFATLATRENVVAALTQVQSAVTHEVQTTRDMTKRSSEILETALQEATLDLKRLRDLPLLLSELKDVQVAYAVPQVQASQAFNPAEMNEPVLRGITELSRQVERNISHLSHLVVERTPSLEPRLFELAKETSLNAVREDLLLSDAQLSERVSELRMEVERGRSTHSVSSVPPPPSSSAPADDLKRIVGIGPALEKLLRRRGIRKFEDLANLSPEAMEELGAKIPRFKGRVRRERWIAQAKKLATAK
jgi:predicted flap endonuclease-1-like 5' DNA nuclease